MIFQDTICAPATSSGTGAISVVRISGDNAFKAADSVIRFLRGTAAEAKGYTFKYGTIYDGDSPLDDVVAAIYRGPHSYTGEDSVEISCHASPYIVGRILELLTASGCRIALPGEFTQRAFLAGKMDLAQAEAVADVIGAQSRYAHKVAINQLKGGYSGELRQLRDKLLELAALLELELDFSEEEVEFANREKLRELLQDAISRVVALKKSFREGNAIKNGVPVAIVGAVNSGKSTLLNALVGEDRAIVSDIAGTTRDTIESTMTLDGIQYRFIDTAGFRDTNDAIEKIGIGKTLEELSKADIVIGVLDGSLDSVALASAASDISGKCTEDQKLILVLNKCDIRSICEHMPGAIEISALTGQGLDKLRTEISSFQKARLDSCSTLVTNARHYEALSAAYSDLNDTLATLGTSTPTDLVAEHLRAAISSMNTIFGESIDDSALLNHIFGAFCIGK